ncbi:MAG: ATP-binding protein [Candidatus Diapherotrites archaeon]|nr:ATP-binding protein [Candidatus Diapherotrites archaeon]
MTEFKDRKRELLELSESIKKKSFAFEIIYGRRRVGKTELILHATQKNKRVYYLAVGENNLERFYNTCVEYDSEVGKLKMDYEVLFDYLKDHINVLIIDEFQNLIKEDPNFLSLLQSIVDIKLKKSSLKLFILGSSVSIITSKVMSYSSPVFGRKTASLKLKPVSFFDLHYFFPKASIEELINIYGFADGIPYYLTMIDKPFWAWLEEETKRGKGFLKDEVDFLMKLEFKNASTYKLILEAIANGKNVINEIKDYIKLQRTDLTPYLSNLIEVGFIKREVPITENIKSRFGRYYLNDNFLKFWFKYIYPNLSSVEQGIFKVDVIKKDYSAYLGFIFKNVCKQYLTRKPDLGYSALGRWWYKNNEIDIVAFNEEKKETLFCECKWQNKVNPEKIMTELIEKAKFVEWNNEKRKEEYILFAKTFTKKINVFNDKKVTCIDLKDMEKTMLK